MRIIVLIQLLTFFNIHVLWSQELNAVDYTVIDYEDISLKNPEKLATQINKDFATELEKARAMYTWIALNIEYDIEAYKKGTNRFSYTYRTKKEKQIKEQQRKKKVAEYTYKKKKGVCDGYANLFQYLCELTDVECAIINGYSKTKLRDIGRTPSRTDHAWNAIKINNKWLLLDATWGAGFVNGNQFIRNFSSIYFDTSPEKFDLQHYPSDSKWKFSNISKKQFVNTPLFYRTYLESDFVIELPKKGIISMKPEKEITIKVKSKTPLKGITYKFSKDKHSNYLKFDQKGTYYVAKIPVTKNKSSTLNLYYRNQGIVVYKLKY